MKGALIFALCMLGLLRAVQFNYVADWPQQINDMVSQNENMEEGPLRKKADEFDVWNVKHHQPNYGGQVGVRFSDATYQKPVEYIGMRDSCIWTGTYLGIQALRYNATKSEAARQNVINNVLLLDAFLHVTNTSGYIARYWASRNSITYKSDEWCNSYKDCHKITEGKYKGDYWEGDTTKDQYSGWFFGMGLAYETIDNDTLKTIIKNDVVEVVDKLIKDEWIIYDQNRSYHVYSAGQRPTYIYQLAWLNMAYHMTGDQKYKSEIQSRLNWFNMLSLRIETITGWFNRYCEYYGHNLAHTAWFNLLRLGKVYFSKDAFSELQGIFSNSFHEITKLSHNPWFGVIFMSQGNYKPSPVKDPYQEELLMDLTDFRPVPNYQYRLPARDPSTYELDHAISWLQYFPWIKEQQHQINVGFTPQALKGFPIRQQCFSDFLFQRNPFSINECGFDDKTRTGPGSDYLAAYWVAVYYGFINKSQ